MIWIGTAVATVVALAASSVYYAVCTPLERRATHGHAVDRGRPGPLKIIAELVRTAVLTAAFAWLATRTGLVALPGALGLAGVLWVAFPAVLLTGSVAWDRAPVPTAALHSGDWLLKMLVIALTIGFLH